MRNTVYNSFYPILLLIPDLPKHIAASIRAFQINTWILHESEAFIGKASKGEDVVFYFEPLVTQLMEASGSPSGWNLMRKKDDNPYLLFGW